MKEYTKYKLQLIAEETITTEREYVIKSTKDVADFLKDICQLHLCPEENFVQIVMNAKGKVIGWKTVAIGELSSCIVHPREVFKFAIATNGFAVIIAHNHPSGDPTPSNEDVRVTKRLKDAGELLGIPVMDSMVIGEGNSYVSLKGEGLV
jgi:DNA repair protein RadC